MEPKNITSQQRGLLTTLETSKENFTYEWDEVRGVLSFVRADSLVNGRNAVARQENNQQTFNDFMKTYAPLFGSPDLTVDSLSRIIAKEDNIGWHHYQFQSYYIAGEGEGKGRIEFYGSKVAAHFKPDGTLVELQSSCYRDIEIANTVKVKAQQLQEGLLKELSGMEGFGKLEEEMKRRKEKLFPLMQVPRQVIYPWKGKMLNTWATYGYAPYTFTNERTQKDNKPVIAFGQLFFNAEDGELFLFAPTRKGAETPATGSGLGCTPLGGPYVNRSLDIVRVDSSSTYLLKNKTKGRDIITYDANADSSVVYPNIPQKISDGSIPVSTDNDGDHNWNRVATSTTDAQRTASQQPEVDEHFRVAALYDWYSALAGRVGWDNNDFSAPLVPHQTLNVVAHCYDDSAGTSRSVNAFFDQELVSGAWISHLAFFDGDPTGVTFPGIEDDYLAGSDAIVGHEYQHAVTDFSFKDGAGNPGLTYDDWFAAVHEGTSDVFGGLFSADWWMANSISPTGQIFRNLAFPRDTAALDPSKFDHWDDRNNLTGFGARYYRGDILAHCAYLMAQGGVHQRSVRTPVLIPVKGLGRETVNGKDVYTAARIWYRGLSLYLSNIGAMTGIPTNDENIYRSFRNATISAAIDLYGVNSVQHKTTLLAWYAVGLQPTGTNYGPDVTFLTWGADWWMSRPYIGVSSPDWSSVDLFINNGGASEWNAQVNVMDMGSPTQFENKVYCRVRNAGDQAANNVQLQFQYAKLSTSGTTWYPITDKDGNIQVLNLGNMSAGASNFPDSDQNTPPASAMIKWWIPPIEAGETVDHYCIKATVFSISDGNPVNNEVQSNIAYVPYTPGEGLRMGFFATNPFREAVPVNVKITNTLPKGWNVRVIEQINGLVLQPGETKRAHIVIDMPAKSNSNLEAPFDGQIKGTVNGSSYTGNLFTAKLTGSGLKAQISLNTPDGRHMAGSFDGSLDLATGKFKGTLTGNNGQQAIEGCLRPSRIVNIGQYYKSEAFGGFSMQVQVPLPQGSCFEALPPTDVYVSGTNTGSGGKNCIEGAEEIIKCLDMSKRDVCSVKLKSMLVEIKFKDQDC
ncbi:MAG TPA: M4 family metallopeptidase [Puia sp.]|jgi:Zn-dependent metalloprotease